MSCVDLDRRVRSLVPEPELGGSDPREVLCTKASDQDAWALPGPAASSFLRGMPDPPVVARIAGLPAQVL